MEPRAAEPSGRLRGHWQDFGSFHPPPTGLEQQQFLRGAAEPPEVLVRSPLRLVSPVPSLQARLPDRHRQQEPAESVRGEPRESSCSLPPGNSAIGGVISQRLPALGTRWSVQIWGAAPPAQPS